jgi:hypothetical protein
MAEARDPFRRQPPGPGTPCLLCVPVARQQRASDPRGRMGHCVGLARARVREPTGRWPKPRDRTAFSRRRTRALRNKHMKPKSLYRSS